MSKQLSTNHSSTKLTTNIQLRIHDIFPAIDQPFFDKYKIVFGAVPFTHLNIDYPTISKEMLVKIINLLPHLDSLKVSSLEFTQPDSFCGNRVEMYGLISVNNKITKVCLEKITDMEQLSFVFRLCRCVEHFQIHVPPNTDLTFFLHHIVRKVGIFVPRLRSLCLHIPNACEITTHELQHQIESEGLLSKYMIKRCGDYIHLQWD